jgi:hypothetical protein
MDDQELERVIAALVKRKKGASEAELAMLNRVLNGLRYKYEDAGGIWESAGGIWESMDTNWEATPP